MGQEEHEETPDSPQTLDPGLDSGSDLVYLHLTGPLCSPDMEEDRGTNPEEEREAEPKDEERGDDLANEEKGENESEAERQMEKCESGQNLAKTTHQPLCRTHCVDLGTEGPPDLPSNPENVAQSPTKSTKNSLDKTEDDGSKDYQAKLDFALKLGYSEEVVRSVLTKLGPETLINDVLGELVRLGTKAEPDQGLGSGLGTGSGSLGSCGCEDEGSADSPALSESLSDQENLRPIVVDGSNVAMSHGNKEVFSCQGIQLAVDWFLERGHHDITVFVPAWRKEQSRPDAPITDQEILRRLEKQKVLVFTPSRRVQGRRVVCYDDRFIVKLAFESDGIIVSNDNYRDLANEKPEWKRFIDERLLMYSFVNDKFMPPDDPLGRHGPSLDNFLRKRPVIPEQKKQPCPYGKKCTYGHKCKYYHPERGAQPQRAVADELRASAKTSLIPKTQTKVQAKTQTDSGLVKSHSVPTGEAHRKGSITKRQSDPSVRALSYSDAEERLLLKNLSGTSGSRTISPAPGGPPTHVPTLPQDELSRLGAPHDSPYPHCHSPEYYCVSRAYSHLSLSSSRPNPDFRPPQDQDYRLGSLGSIGSAGSECGSESSSCDSCPPESLMDDFHYPRLYAPPSSAPHDFCSHPNEYPYPLTPPKRPLYPLPPHMHHQPLSARSSCPGDYHHSPLPLPGSPLARRLAPPLPESVSDSHLYEHFTHPHHPRPKILPHWETYYRPPLAASRYEASSSCYWDSYGSPTHYPPPPPPPPHSSGPPYPPVQNPHSGVSAYPQPTDSPGRSRYSEVRDKVYVNLCNIFPSELVSRVMARNPHLTDPQQLAAAILAEKAQTGY